MPTLNRIAADTVRVGASQATGFVQPRHWPARTMTRSRARRPPTMSRTWTGPAAWRNVPHVVETGNRRVVAPNVSALRRSDRAQGRAAADPGQGDEPEERDRGARHEQDVEQVVGEALDPRRHEPGRAPGPGSGTGSAGPARRRCRIRSPTARSSPPGRAAGCRTRSSRGRATERGSRTRRSPGPTMSRRRSGRVVPAARHATTTQTRPSHRNSLRVRAARPKRIPSATRRPSIGRAPAWLARDADHEQARRRGRGP